MGVKMTDFVKIDQYLTSHLDESIVELSRLCAQPSVSAQNYGLKECAALVGEMLKKRGFKVEVISTTGAPVVFAERPGRSTKTMLFYNHYDVQPAEPLELWDTPPFEPNLRNGKLYARGACDDKGHIVNRLFSLDALLAETEELPCNIKFIIEGEEETSSVHLHEFVAQHKARLAADACIWESGGVDNQDHPQQSIGMRGICYVELSVQTASQDVHSGLGGSIFPNAAWRLVWALSTLKGPDEHINLPGFYDKVRPASPRARQLLAEMPDDAAELKQRYGLNNFLKGLTGGVELRLQGVYQPTCTICGLNSGYQGPGSKTVLPAKASAKVDFRLVPDQEPEDVVKQLRAHLDAGGFNDVHIEVLGGEAPAATDPDDPFIQLVVKTAAGVYNYPMQVVPMIGGSGPNAIIQKAIKVPIALVGVGYPGAQVHAPNENLRLDLYLKGAQHVTRILEAFSKDS
jgi:acetylornithine deacetylase/succinyl-diaminopimelate desuccinylase-like protein